MTNTLFIKIEELKRNSMIDANVSDKLMKLTLLNAQDQILEPILGTKLYEDLLTKTRLGTLSLSEANLIVKYIWPCLIHATVYKTLMQISFSVGNTGVTSNSVTQDDIKGLREEEAYTYKHYGQKLTMFLQANTGTFPLYAQTDVGQIAASTSEVNYIWNPIEL